RGREPRLTAKGGATASDRVDLVDEHDALAAPLARELLRLAGHVADDDHVHADEGLGEPGSRHRQERRVEAGRDRLRQHRLPRAWSTEEEQATFSLSARFLEGLARLPQVDD